jgi:endonuclease/exonuclease/phosphatase family metal-dependent hydrolase
VQYSFMRAASWNLWWRFGGKWRERQRGIISTLEDLRADVVGLQEVWAGDGTSQAKLLAERLGMHSAFAAPSLPPPPMRPESPDQDGFELGVAVLSRWPVLHEGRHRLPSAHRAPPVALLVTLDHPLGPLHVMTSCVEWEPEFAEDHLAQTRALARLLVDPALDGPLPVLLAADLNASPETPQVQALTNVMVDTWIAGGGDPHGVTLSSHNPFAPKEATQQIDGRIDYVLARPGTAEKSVSVERAFVASAAVDHTYPSDHYAVVADLAF